VRLVVGLLLLAACDQLFGIDPVPAHDASVDTTDAGEECIGGVLFQICYDPATVPAMLPASRAIDTTTNAQCTQVRDGTPPVCIIIAQQVDIEDSLRIVGPDPVAIVSTGDLVIGSAGIIDVSSQGGGIPSPGAGADTGACTTMAGEAQGTIDNRAGGGAGGSFGGMGGPGGSGPSKVANGQPAPLDESTLHGGCPGGAGGARNGSAQARGGDGGGAVYVVAKGTIHIAGRISANAERGYGGNTTSPADFPGGGGGGAGGMIVLDADVIVVDAGAALVANGGGGGGGANGTQQGRDGTDGASTGAPGGSGGGGGTSIGGDGGAGSSRNRNDGSPGGSGGSTQGGGGGGGGGAGFIRIRAPHGKTINATNVSPPDS
jgi:hypothetical protein